MMNDLTQQEIDAIVENFRAWLHGEPYVLPPQEELDILISTNSELAEAINKDPSIQAFMASFNQAWQNRERIQSEGQATEGL